MTQYDVFEGGCGVTWHSPTGFPRGKGGMPNLTTYTEAQQSAPSPRRPSPLSTPVMLSLTLPAVIPLPILLAILAITFIRPRSSTSSYPIRDSIVSPQQEHVLILGGSSGVGEALVRRYAERGAKM